jgi:aryl-alcohol dehydrogenase-like predicted oxidoreductase
MQPATFGRTDWSIPRIGLGAMPLSIAGRPERKVALDVIARAVELGVEFIDTADVYCLDDDDLGHNERLVADALEAIPGARGKVHVATKGGLRRPRGAWVTDATPERLRAACEASLRALRRDCIDLYQLHAPDARVPFADSVGELAKLRAEGKIRHVGLSNVTTQQLAEAMRIVPIVSVQNRLNPFERGPITRGLVQVCESNDIVFLPHSPVGGHGSAARVAKDPVLSGLARRLGATPHEITLAWLLAIGPHVFPIPGASRRASIESSVRAASIVLDPAARKALRDAFGA